MVEMNAMLASESSDFYYLFDSNNDVTVLEELVAKGTVVKADTAEDLAKQLNINISGLNATIARYNELTGKEDADFGKATELMLGFGQAPFYGIKAYAEILLSFGGPVVNAECEFVKEDGSTIPGVYGAGELTNSRLIRGWLLLWRRRYSTSYRYRTHRGSECHCELRQVKRSSLLSDFLLRF